MAFGIPHRARRKHKMSPKEDRKPVPSKMRRPCIIDDSDLPHEERLALLREKSPNGVLARERKRLEIAAFFAKKKKS